MADYVIAKSVTFHRESGEYLIVKRAEHDTNPGLWEFPGGGVEAEDRRETALRELREETGLEGDVKQEGSPTVVEKDSLKFRFHPFLIHVETREVELSHEHQKHRWVELSEIESFETVEGVKQDLKSVGVLDGEV